MSNSDFDQKIQDVFGEFAIDKGLVRRLGATGEDRHVPSYVMDWIVTHNAKSHQSTGSIEHAVRDFIAKHLPPKGDKERIRFLLSQDETLVLLDAIKRVRTEGAELDERVIKREIDTRDRTGKYRDRIAEVFEMLVSQDGRQWQ